MNNDVELRLLLNNIRFPEKLNHHPWVKSLLVKNEVSTNPSLKDQEPGQQLIVAVSNLFQKMMPSTEPKNGKRIDSKWAQFGILAAQYFAPVVYGSPFPTSLRDACGRIDEAICSFVFKKPGIELSNDEIAQYQIIGDEAEIIPVSTLSDWSSSAVEKFSEIIDSQERFLYNSSQNILGQKNQNRKNGVQNERSLGYRGFWHSKEFKLAKKFINVAIVIILLVGIVLGGLKIRKVYQAILPVKDDLVIIQQLAGMLDESQSPARLIKQVVPVIGKTTSDLDNLYEESKSVLWICPAFFWIPEYGEDIAHAGDLLNYAYKVTLATNLTLGAASPIIDQITQEEKEIDITEIVNSIKIVQLQLSTARDYLDEANTSIQKVDMDRLSTKSKGIMQKIVPLVDLFYDGLTVAVEFPEVLGSSDEGPKTYIVLIQNNDELRATGGFITGVATIVIEDGKILTFKVEDSYAVDNDEQYYPPAPWQLERYMNAYHWVFRDSNWSPDFPTAAKWAEMFIATGRNYSVDGVIAVDQESLRYILKALGPVHVEGADSLVTSDNVIQYMRKEKNEVASEDAKLHRKDFMSYLTQGILQKLKSGNQIPWITLGKQVVMALNEKHILIQIDNPKISSVINKHDWGGSYKKFESDYLFVVNSNIGFNKVNAVVKTEIKYSVNLTDPNFPSAKIQILNTNNAKGNPVCSISNVFSEKIKNYDDLINLCYLDYLRVYKPKSDELIDSVSHIVPAAMLPWNEDIPAKVDYLLEENTDFINGYGTLLVVPGNKSVVNEFSFSLPATVVSKDGETYSYHLSIQKQSGTNSIPVEVYLELPEGVTILDSSIDGEISNNTLEIVTSLQEDVDLLVSFLVP